MATTVALVGSRRFLARPMEYSEDQAMILRIVEAEVCGSHSLRLGFNNGTRKSVDVQPLLSGPIFEPPRDPGYFARAILDPICGTVIWPKGADFAPEAPYELAPVHEPSATSCDRGS